MQLSHPYWNRRKGGRAQSIKEWQSDCPEVKNLPAMQKQQEMWVQSLVWEDPLQKEMATHSNILAWEISWTQEPGGLYSMRSQRVSHDEGLNNKFKMANKSTSTSPWASVYAFHDTSASKMTHPPAPWQFWGQLSKAKTWAIAQFLEIPALSSEIAGIILPLISLWNYPTYKN